MMKPYCYLLSVLLLTWGCGTRAPEPVSETKSDADVVSYDGEWYGFNGRTIVRKDSLYGVLDEERRIVLPVVYDAAEFLSDDVLLVNRLGSWLLADRFGRVFEEGPDAAVLRENWQVLYEQALEADRERWDAVLDRFEELCRRGAMLRSGHPSTAEMTAFDLLQKELMSYLDDTPGRPDEQQQLRFERLVGTYAGLRK